MKSRFVAILISFVLICLIAYMLFSHNASSARLIGVVQFVHHPLLDETYKGVISELTKLGLNDGTDFQVKTQIADKDVQLSSQITRQFLDQGAILIIAIATPSAQAASAQTETIPIVFAAITDPVAAKLVNTLDHPASNLTGTSNRWPFEKQIALIPSLLPNVKRIGAVWNPGEVNSQAAMESIRPLARKAGIEVVDAPVASTADVAAAAKSIADRIDAFIMIPDNTALAATSALVQISLDTKKPLIGGDMDTVRKGSLASYGYDYFELGQITAQMAKSIIMDGQHPASMPVQYPPESKLIINQSSADKFGIVIPDSVKAQATEIIN